MNILNKIKALFRKTPKAAEIKIFDEYLKVRKSLSVSDLRTGNGKINFKINYQGSVVPFWTKLTVADAVSIIAIGIVIGFNLVELSQKLKDLSL